MVAWREPRFHTDDAKRVFPARDEASPPLVVEPSDDLPSRVRRFIGPLQETYPAGRQKAVDEMLGKSASSPAEPSEKSNEP